MNSLAFESESDCSSSSASDDDSNNLHVAIGDRAKLQFAFNAIQEGRSYLPDDRFSSELAACVSKTATEDPSALMAMREFRIQQIEAKAAMYNACGATQEWLSKSDPCIQRISQNICGPLLEELAFSSGFCDAQCVYLFRDGAQLMGQLPHSGIGSLLAKSTPIDLGSFAQENLIENRKLISTLAEDEHSDKLFKQAIDDASCGRMEYPVQLHDDDTFLASVRIARRFSVEQGVKPDGSLKVRAVDDESRNGVNGVTDATEKLSTQGVDL